MGGNGYGMDYQFPGTDEGVQKPPCFQEIREPDRVTDVTPEVQVQRLLQKVFQLRPSGQSPSTLSRTPEGVNDET